MGKREFKPGNMLNPLPVVMVTCLDEEGKPNIITVAWAGTINTNPPMASISVRPSRYSYAGISKRKAFVINLVSEELTKAADYCGVKSGRDVDKFKECNLTPCRVPGTDIPGIAESPCNIYCEVVEEKLLGSHAMFISNVCGVQVDDQYFDEKDAFHLNDAKLVTYSHGQYRKMGNPIGKFGFSVQKSKKKKLRKFGI